MTGHIGQWTIVLIQLFSPNSLIHLQAKPFVATNLFVSFSRHEFVDTKYA